MSLLVLVVSTLAVTACNFGSVAGSQPKASTSTNAESKSPSGSAPKGFIGSALKHTGG
jgi:hypothetical protein